MKPTIYKPGAYNTPGIYKGAGGIYKGRGVYNDGAGVNTNTYIFETLDELYDVVNPPQTVIFNGEKWSYFEGTQGVSHKAYTGFLTGILSSSNKHIILEFEKHIKSFSDGGANTFYAPTSPTILLFYNHYASPINNYDNILTTKSGNFDLSNVPNNFEYYGNPWYFIYDPNYGEYAYNQKIKQTYDIDLNNKTIKIYTNDILAYTLNITNNSLSFNDRIKAQCELGTKGFYIRNLKITILD